MKPWIALLVAAPLTLGAVGVATLLSADTVLAPVENSLKIEKHEVRHERIDANLPAVSGNPATLPEFAMLMGFNRASLDRYIANHHLEGYIGIVKCGEFNIQTAERPVTVEMCGGQVTGVMQRLPNGSVSVAQS